MLGLLLVFSLLLLVGTTVYLVLYFRWEARLTRGTAYFGAPLFERRAIKEAIRRRSSIALRCMGFLGKVARGRFFPIMSYRGIDAPRFKCTPATFRKAIHFRPEAGDVIVATQMKCGTTWMQQVVYETLSRGRGDLSDAGHVHLYALSPWLESFDSVSLEDAPRIGACRARLIKTHLPVDLCPYGPEAKYIYVTRHPVSCFASCVDFAHLLAGPLVPPRKRFVEEFCSERMLWGPWPKHVSGWWRWSRTYSNVLFVHFEEMHNDLRGVVLRVARFLGEELSEQECDEVVRKSSFAYMKEREERFEMSPPNLFSVAGDFLKSGKADRYKDVSDADRQQILAYCRQQLAGSDYPVARFYPDLLG